MVFVFLGGFISSFGSFCIRYAVLVWFSLLFWFFVSSFGWGWLRFNSSGWWLSEFVQMGRIFLSLLFLQLFCVLGPVVGHSLILSHQLSILSVGYRCVINRSWVFCVNVIRMLKWWRWKFRHVGWISSWLLRCCWERVSVVTSRCFTISFCQFGHSFLFSSHIRRQLLRFFLDEQADFWFSVYCLILLGWMILQYKQRAPSIDGVSLSDD